MEVEGLLQKTVVEVEVFPWNCGDDVLSWRIVQGEEVLHWMVEEVEVSP